MRTQHATSECCRCCRGRSPLSREMSGPPNVTPRRAARRRLLGRT
jgi:hypothetical protein